MECSLMKRSGGGGGDWKDDDAVGYGKLCEI